MATHTTAPIASGGRREVLLTALCFACLAVLHTWPMLRLAGSHIVQAGDDGLLCAWQLTALVQSVLVHPLSPLDVNMYYPYGRALATLSSQLSSLPVTLPVWLLSHNPALVVNLFTIVTFGLAGFLTARLVTELTGSAAAGIVAGSIFAFSTARFEDLGHTHILGNCWLPLVLLTVHRFARQPGWARMWAMTAAFLMLALASEYLAIIGGVAVLVVGLAEFIPPRGRLRAAVAPAIVSLAAVGLVLGSVARVYYGVASDYAAQLPRASSVLESSEHLAAPAFDRTVAPEVLQSLSAPLESYLATRPDSRLRGLMPLGVVAPPGLRLFPGTIAVVLAAIGLARAFRRSDRSERRRTLLYLGVACAAALLSFGPEIRAFGRTIEPGLYPAAWPPFNLMRMPARFSMLFTLAVAVLAGDGVAALGRLRSRRLRVGLVVAAAALLNLELSAAPLQMRPVGRVPQAYLWLKHAPPGPVVEFPVHQNIDALYWSLYSDQPLLNGYGLIEPSAYQPLKAPDYLSPGMIEHLRSYAGLRYLVIDREAFDVLGPEATRVLDENLRRSADQLRLAGRFGRRDVYEVGGLSRGTVVLRSFLPSMLIGKRTVRVRAHIDHVDPRGPAVVQIWGNGRLLGSQAADGTPGHDVVTVPLPSEGARGLNLEVMADYRLPAAAAMPVGRTGRALAADVRLTADRARTRIEVNGHVWVGLKGYTVVTFGRDGAVMNVRAFNTSWSEDESRALAAYLGALPPESAIALASAYDASRGLTSEAVNALADFGIAGDLRGRFGWAHVAIGVKGAPAGTAVEAIDADAAVCQLGSPTHMNVVVDDLSIK